MSGYEKEIKRQEEQKNKIRERYKGVDRNELEFIPAKPREKLFEDTAEKRVCAYCRVSTDDVNQTSSYELQKNHYEDMIKEHQGWELVGIYADEGISGTSLQHRDEFNRMIKDCKAGKIDMIIVKNIPRFARNTLDTLKYVRMLKEINVAVYFEKENIWTLDAKGELLITIMSSLAQEESRSISENVTWGHRKRFADGKVSLAFSHFLGYDRGMDGNLIVNKKQAEIVKLIYRLYLSGYTFHSIAKELTERKIPTPAGCKIWRANTIRSILMNEKYKGDALLQEKNHG